MKKFWKKHSIYKLKACNSQGALIRTFETRSAIRCERMIHKLEVEGLIVNCLPSYDKKIFILARLRNNIAKKFKTEKLKTEEDVNKKCYKLQKLLEYLEGVKVPCFKVPTFLRSSDCILKILSPVPSILVDDGKEKQFILEYNLTNKLWNRAQYEAAFEQIVNFTATTACYKQLTNEKVLFKFLKKTKIKKQWDSFSSNPWTLTIFGALVGIVGEKIISAIFDIFNNQQEIILHIIK